MKPYHEHAGITIYHGDCLEVMNDGETFPFALEDASVVTDPPYNVGFKYESYKDSRPEDEYLGWLRDVWENCATMLEAQNIVWFWQGIRVANGEVRQVLPLGWHIHHLGAWFKKEFAGDLWKGGHPAFSWEPIIWAAINGDVKFAGPRGGHDGRDGIVDISSRHDKDAKGHPCNKTFRVVKTVCRWLPSSLIVDPFCGSGTTLKACAQLGKKAIGIEIEEKYCEIAAKRLAQEVFDFTEAPCESR